jgi:hypothetical protein
MRENYARFRAFQKIKTQRGVNEEATILLGLSTQEFMIGMAALLVISLLPITGAPFFGFGLGVSLMFLSKAYRDKVPPRFFQHFFWSLGAFDPKRETPGVEKKAFKFLNLFGRLFLYKPKESALPNPFAKQKRRFVILR